MKVVLYGATGMVGAGVLIECLEDSRITSVVCVGRKPSGVSHPKVRDVVRSDMFDYSDIGDVFNGTDACFYCLGVTSLGMDEAAYTRVTVDMTVAAANALAKVNPTMTFCFVSGQGTDSSGQGKVMWARVKGRAENAILAMPFKAYIFRPGYIQPMKGVRSKTTWVQMSYNVIAPLYPLIRPFIGSFATTTENVGKAMLAVATRGDEFKVLDNADINRIAEAS